MTTDPYLPRAATAIKSTIQHIWAATAHPKTGPAFDLTVIDGQLAFDSGWSPYARASLTCARPLDAANLAALDPRSGCEIWITIGYRYDDGAEDAHTVAHLSLTASTLNRPDNTIELTLNGEEYRAQESICWAASTQFSSDGISEAMEQLINYALIPNLWPVVDNIGAGVRPDLVAEHRVERGQKYWSFIESITAASGTYARYNGLQWEVGYRPTYTSTTTETTHLATGTDGTITKAAKTLDRRDWYNAVMSTHTWRDAQDTDHQVVAIARTETGPYSVDTLGYKTLTVESASPASQTVTDAEAESILDRAVKRGEEYEIDSVSMYWLRPDQTVVIDLDDAPPVANLVTGVQFRFPSGDMTVNTATPPSATTE